MISKLLFKLYLFTRITENHEQNALQTELIFCQEIQQINTSETTSPANILLQICFHFLIGYNSYRRDAVLPALYVYGMQKTFLSETFVFL